MVHSEGSMINNYDVNSLYPYLPPVDFLARGGIKPYIYVGMWTPTEWRVYSVVTEIADWIKQQPEDMWVGAENTKHLVPYAHPYAVSPELEAWIKLKWG